MRHAAARTLAGLALITPVSGAGADIIRVDPGAAGDGSGATWTDAATSVQAALDLADAGDEIWIKAGTYLPPPVDIGYEITHPVTIRGGFAGNESHPDQRPADGPATVFSGDTLGNDGPDFTNREDNASGMFEMWSVADTVRFDRVTIEAVNGGPAIDAWFSSVSIESCQFQYNSLPVSLRYPVSVRVTNSRFAENQSQQSASALDVRDGFDLLISGSVFERNRSDGGPSVSATGFESVFVIGSSFTDNHSGESFIPRAAGLKIEGGNLVSAVLISNDFFGNELNGSGSRGAGAYLSNEGSNGSPAQMIVANCRFGRNQAVDNGGGLYIHNPNGSSTISNSIFVANASQNAGGGIYAVGDLTITNSVLYANSISGITGFITPTGAGVMADTQTPVRVFNSILWANNWEGHAGFPEQAWSYAGADLRASLVDALHPTLTQYYDDATFDADPGFLNPAGPDGVLGTADDDFTLSIASPCIDAGNAELLPPDRLDLDNDGDTSEPLPLDARGWPRRVDVPGTPDALPGQSPAVDIGPFEYQLADCPADLAEPVGSLDAADALAFITLFNTQDPAADLAAPFGALNFFDIAAYITTYNAGCP